MRYTLLYLLLNNNKQSMSLNKFWVNKNEPKNLTSQQILLKLFEVCFFEKKNVAIKSKFQLLGLKVENVGAFWMLFTNRFWYQTWHMIEYYFKSQQANLVSFELWLIFLLFFQLILEFFKRNYAVQCYNRNEHDSN